MKQIDRDPSMEDTEIYHAIDRVILRAGRKGFASLRDKSVLREDLFDALRRYDVLEKYLRDESVSEIMVVGPSRIFIEKDGEIIRTEDSFPDEETVRRLIDQIIAPSNRIVNESSPIADSRLPDGSRVHIILPPVSLVGPVITIRKFAKGGMTIDKLIRFGEFPGQLSPVLGCMVRGRYNILVSGATNSGKSSLLNALAEYIGPSERVITIEDSAELQFYHVDNLVRLETRNSNAEGMNEITMDDLIKASLRMRPDRIIVGESRGKEATSMLQALSTGHSGSFSTIHANSCRDSLRRLETLVLMGMDMPLRAIQGMIASSIDILIHLDRPTAGQRKLTQMYELCGFDGTSYQLNPLFLWKFPSEVGGLPAEGRLCSENRLMETGKLVSYGEYERYIEAMDAYEHMEEE